MPSTFTTNLGMEKPANGEQDQIWGDTANANFDKIDAGMGWYYVTSGNFGGSPIAQLQLPLPSKFQHFRLTWRDFAPALTSYLGVQYSVDGGLSWISTGYATQGASQAGGVMASVGGTGTRIVVSPATTAGGNGTWGYHEFYSVGFKYGRSHCAGLLSTGGMFITEVDSMSVSFGTATATHIQIFFEGTQTVSGQYRLLGASGN